MPNDFLPPIRIIYTKNLGVPDQMQVGDFDGDKNLDFLVTKLPFEFSGFSDRGSYINQAEIFLGDGKGGFSSTNEILPKNINIDSGRFLINDFNKDGLSDVFFVSAGLDLPPFPGGQNILLTSNSVTKKLDYFRSSLPAITAFHHDASMGDLDGDGLDDIVVNALSQGEELLLNKGLGIFELANIRLPKILAGENYSHTTSQIIDVNNDGHNDLILGNDSGDGSVLGRRSQLFLNTGAGDFSTVTGISLPKSIVPLEIVLDIEQADINKDQLPDLVISVTNGGDYRDEIFYKTPYIQILINQGNGKFFDDTDLRFNQTAERSADTSWFFDINIADVNLDSHDDIIGFGTGSQPMTIFYNDGLGDFSYDRSLSFPYVHGTSGDFNRDGAVDLIIEDVNGSYLVYLNSKGDKNYTDPNGLSFPTEHYVSGSDFMFCGEDGADVFYMGDPGARVFGGEGIDLAKFSFSSRDSRIEKDSSASYLSEVFKLDGGTYSFNSVERLQFSDVAIALDSAGVAGQAYRIYKASFDRTPDEPGLGYWISQMDKGMDVVEVAARFIDSPEFIRLYGSNVSNATFITNVYNNVLDRSPDDSGLAWWVSEMQTNPAKTWQKVLADFSESGENKSNVAALVANGIAYDPWA
jgi:hypothetical protein